MARPAPDPTFILRGCDGPVTALCSIQESSGKEVLLSGTQNGTITSWNVHLKRPAHSIQAHNDQSVLCLKQCEEAEVLSHGRNGFVYKWSCTGNNWQKLDAFPATSLGYCPTSVFKLEGNPTIAVPASSQSTVDVTAMDTKDKLFSLVPKGQYGMCTDMVFTEIDKTPLLLVAYENGSIGLWDLTKKTLISQLDAHVDTVMNFDYCGTINKGVSGSVDNKLCVWSISNMELVKIKDLEITNPGVNCVKFRKDGKLFAVGCWDSQVRLFSGKKQTPLVVLGLHKASIQSLTFFEDNTLVVGSKDATISLWDIYK